MLRQVKHGVKNLIHWFPVIWKNREYDHSYLLIILQKKLELMEEYFRTKSHCMDGDKQANDVKYAILLINRLIKDDYTEIPYKKHVEKFGELEFTDEGLKHTKVKSRKQEMECDKSFNEYMKRGDYLKKQDLDELFKHIRKHLESWWD